MNRLPDEQYGLKTSNKVISKTITVTANSLRFGQLKEDCE